MTRSKTFRLHHNRRMFRRAYHLELQRERHFVYGWVGRYKNEHMINYDRVHKKAKKIMNNMAICSCYHCGNQRRNPWQEGRERLTLQERRNELSWREWMREC